MVLTGEGKAVVLEVSVLPNDGKEPLPRRPGEDGECVLPLVCASFMVVVCPSVAAEALAPRAGLEVAAAAWRCTMGPLPLRAMASAFMVRPWAVLL